MAMAEHITAEADELPHMDDIKKRPELRHSGERRSPELHIHWEQQGNSTTHPAIG
jgi:hypothetical protein